MDGFEATRAIRSHGAFHMLRLPIIAMTTHSDVNEITACFRAGMNDHTSKPIIIDKFLSTIRRWLPVDTNAATILNEIIPQLLDSGGEAGDGGEMEREAILGKLLPVLHEGRVDWIRGVLAEGNTAIVAGMFAALAAIAREESAGSGTHDAP